MPIGGFTGTIPEPTLATLQNLIRTGFVATFLQSPTTIDPRLTWIARHCLNVVVTSVAGSASGGPGWCQAGQLLTELPQFPRGRVVARGGRRLAPLALDVVAPGLARHIG